MWRRLFPESLFPRRLGEDSERRMRLAHARAEEAIIEAHARNALMFIDTLAEDMPFDRAIDTYVRMMAVPEPLASIVATRVLVELGDELVPRRVLRPREEHAPESFGETLPEPGNGVPAVRILLPPDDAPADAAPQATSAPVPAALRPTPIPGS